MSHEEAVPAVETLDEERCWEVLRRLEFGRLAYQLGGKLHLTPLNYAVHGDVIVFRTAEGSKLSGMLEGGEVVFEVDEIRDDEAYSVVVRACPREFGADEARWADQMRLRPWVATVKEHVVGLAPTEMSGRRFNLSRGWMSMLPRK